MRSLLFSPGDSERKLLKSLESKADVVLVDLEDSVAPANKLAARTIARDFIARHRGGAQQFYVRVNDLTTGLTADDLEEVVPSVPHGIMLPKAASAADIEHLSAVLRVCEARSGLMDGAIRIIPLITETPRALLAAHTYTRADPRLAGVTWGAEDLSAAIGARTARDEHGAYTDLFRLARSTTLLVAGALDVAAIDTVFPDFRDEKGFERDCREAERDGFTAKMAIHPSQVSIINAVFTPSSEAISKAEAVVEAFRQAGDAGVVAIEGKMYDRPHLKLAERLLARAGKT